jgi:very-short-patch-repair endonuclease
METQRTHREARLARLAQSQFGVFTRAQALNAGFTASAIKQRLNRGVWTLADHNVYRVSATPASWHQRIIAACVAGPAVASHRSAGLLWELPGIPDGIVEVTALRHRRRRASDVIWHESYHLADRDITEIGGIPCTRPIRTFLDLGVVLSPDELETALNEGIRRNLLSVPAIAQRLEELGPLRRGTTAVRAALRRRASTRRAPESVLETRFLQLVRSAGLPAPTPQFQVRLGERVVARLDFAYPSRRIAIELDGAAYHSGRLAEGRDRRRDNSLGALGWRVLRFDWDDVTRRTDYVLGTMRSLGLR